MAAKQKNRTKTKGAINWPVVLAVSFLLSAAALIYIAFGNDLGRFSLDPESWLSFFTSTKETIDGEGEGKVHVIDVGQGDAILLQFDGKNVLIDGATESDSVKLIGYLDRLSVDTLDLIIATHPHADHIGGLDRVIERCDSVGEVWFPEIPDDLIPTTQNYLELLEVIEETNTPLSLVHPGDSLSFSGGKLTVLGPVKEYDDLNDCSLVMKLQLGSKSFLFTGDMEADAEQDLIDSGADLSADVLKLGHHGSETSSSQAFLDAVGASYFVISVGEGNSYNHPHAETLNRLVGKTVYRTDLNGTVVFTVSGGELTVSTEKGG